LPTKTDFATVNKNKLHKAKQASGRTIRLKQVELATEHTCLLFSTTLKEDSVADSRHTKGDTGVPAPVTSKSNSY
jgi:hypothetical protein